MALFANQAFCESDMGSILNFFQERNLDAIQNFKKAYMYLGKEHEKNIRVGEYFHLNILIGMLVKI